MRLILKYIKPYSLLVVIAIILLFCQSMSDLTLPNLMSDIVDTGVMKNGVEDIAPSEISKEGYSFMKLFMSEEDGKIFDSAYKYEQTEGEGKSGYFELVETDEDKIGEVDSIFGRSAMVLVNYMKELSNQNPNVSEGQQEQAGSGAEAKDLDVSEIDLNGFYAMYDGILAQKQMGALDGFIKDSEKYDSMLPDQMGNAITRLFYEERGIDLEERQSDYIANTGLKMLAVTFLGIVAAIIVGFISAKIGAAVGQKMRRDVFAKVESFSNAEFDKFSTASLITRTTNDVQQVQMLITMGLRLMCYAPILGIGGVIMAVNKSSSLSWIIAVAVIVLLGLILIVISLALPKFKVVQKLVDKINLVSRENLSGMLVIRAFGNEKYEEDRFNDVNRELANTNQFIQRVMAFIMPAMMIVMNGVSLAIIWVGAHAISESSLQVGAMMAFIQYTMQIIMAFLMLAMMFIMIPRASVSLVRIKEVLDTELTIEEVDEKKAGHINSERVTVEFKNVFFKYANAEDDVLENITLIANPGETTAFIGSTGSGKSTIINLIPRFYDVTRGSIEFNGVNIKDIAQNELRENIGYVPQKGVLFTGTIESNIKYGKENAAEEEILKAIEVAQATDFVEGMEEKTATEIAQGGSNVSGGQKQRLSIARALVKNPPVYIFDDSFSALDFKTDASLRRALKQYTSNATVFIVAQRVSTIMDAEQIVVLDEGKIVGIGKHKELLVSCETYREIAESQLSKGELA